MLLLFSSRLREMSLASVIVVVDNPMHPLSGAALGDGEGLCHVVWLVWLTPRCTVLPSGFPS